MESERFAGHHRKTVYTITNQIRFYDCHCTMLRVYPLKFCVYCLNILILTNCLRNQDAVILHKGSLDHIKEDFRAIFASSKGIFTSKTNKCHNEYAFIHRTHPDLLDEATYCYIYQGLVLIGPPFLS